MTEMDELNAMLTKRGIEHTYRLDRRDHPEIFIPDATLWYFDAKKQEWYKEPKPIPYLGGMRISLVDEIVKITRKHCNGVLPWINRDGSLIVRV